MRFGSRGDCLFHFEALVRLGPLQVAFVALVIVACLLSGTRKMASVFLLVSLPKQPPTNTHIPVTPAPSLVK